MNPRFRKATDPANPAQRLHDQIRLRADLCTILQVLEGTSTTAHVVWAWSRPPFRPGLDYLDQSPASPTCRDPGECNAREVTRCGARDEHGSSIRQASHPSPLGGKALDGHVDYRAGCDRFTAAGFGSRGFGSRGCGAQRGGRRRRWRAAPVRYGAMGSAAQWTRSVGCSARSQGESGASLPPVPIRGGFAFTHHSGSRRTRLAAAHTAGSPAPTSPTMGDRRSSR